MEVWDVASARRPPRAGPHHQAGARDADDLEPSKGRNRFERDPEPWQQRTRPPSTAPGGRSP
ncbi:Protein of unknown function [Gryllus bimaculatus]|nr:Protein of unknown function [Gryllus bimaculatus]